MQIKSYNNELAFANLLFKRLFNNIEINRKGPDGTDKKIKVQCILGNRSRIYKNLENPEKAGLYSLPMIVITRTGITRNADRLAKLHNEILNSPHSQNPIYDLYTPVPIDLEYTVTIISKYPGDVDLILSNFIPFFNSDLFVSCVHPKFRKLTYSSQVIMGDSISEEHPEELDDTADDITTTTLTFTFKTYIFAGSSKVDAKMYVGDDGSTIYDGFVPVITKLLLDIHAVPRHDITLPTLSTDVSTVIVVDKETGKSSIEQISAEVMVPFSRDEYSFEKYFDDFYGKDLFSDDYKPCLRDSLNWVLANTILSSDTNGGGK